MKILNIIFLVLFTSILSAKSVTYEDAELVAKNWYKNYSPVKNATGNIKEYFTTKYEGNTSFYTFVFNEGGWINIAADDIVTPILAYSFKSKAYRNSKNPAYNEWMKLYEERIRSAKEKELFDENINEKWELIRNSKFGFNLESKDINPLLNENGIDYQWGQGNIFNDLCPNVDGTNTPVGCVATAMAQIMRYYQYPFHGNLHYGYNWEYESYNEYLFENFETAAYYWNQMPTVREDIIWANDYVHNQLSIISYQTGVSVEMQYAPEGSSSNLTKSYNSFIDFFHYDNTANIQIKNNYTQTEWENILKNELDNYRPILYSGHNNESGHAFVCDGYKSDGSFHFNWGWDGDFNGWFMLNDLTPSSYDYTDSQAAIIGIQPKEIEYWHSHSLDSDTCIPNQLLTYTLYLTEDSNPAFGYEVKLKFRDSSNNIIDYPSMTQNEVTSMYEMDIVAPEQAGNFKYYSEIWTTNLTENKKILTTTEKDLIVGTSDFICSQVLNPPSHKYLPGEELNYEIDLDHSGGNPETGYDVKYGLKIKNENQFEVGNCVESPAGSGIYSISINAPDIFNDYQIYAYVFSGSELLFQSDPIDFIVDQEPDIPILLYPENNADNISLHPDFYWEEIDNADSYDFAIYDMIDGSYQQIKYESGLIEGFYHLTSNEFEYDEGYNWTVRSRIAGNIGEWATLNDFRTQNYLEKPQLKYPSNNDTNVKLTPLFVWDKLDNADYYRIKIAPDPELNDYIDYSNIVSNSFEMPIDILNHSTQYYWNIKAYSSNGDSDYSDVFTFRTGGEIPPEKPFLISPANNDTDISLTPELVWEEGDGVALSFSLQISTDSVFTNVVYQNESLEFENFVVPVSTLENEITYYWRVKGINESGDGNYSSIFNFTTTNEPPGPGSILWTLKLGSDVDGIPVFDKEGNIYINTSLDLVKISPENGEVIFTLNNYCMQEDNLAPTLSQDGNTIYTIVSRTALGEVEYPHYLVSMDLNGNLIWKYGFPFGDVYKPVLDNNGNIYVAVSDGNAPYDGQRCIYSIDSNGDYRWMSTPESDSYTDFLAHPSVSNNFVYIAIAYSSIQGTPGKIRAYNTTNGTIAWEKSVGNTESRNYNVAINNSNIIFPTDDDKMYVINKNNGNTVTGWPITANDYFRTTSVIDEEGIIYNGTDENNGNCYVYALNTDGSIKWQKDIIDDMTSTCVLDNNGKLYCASRLHTLYSIEKSDGNTDWSVNLARTIYGTTIGPSGTLYVSADATNSSGVIDSLSFYAIKTNATGLADSDWANQFHDYQGTCCYDSQSILYPPNNLIASTISYSEINLSWSDISNDTGYYIYRSNNPDSNFVKIDSVAQDIIEFSNVNLNPLTEYFYKITSYDGINESVYSEAVSATTVNIPAPQNLTSILKDKNITLTWVNQSEFTPDSITVYRNNSKLVSLAGIDTSYTDSSLGYGNYSYYLRSFINPDIESENSNITSENISDTDIIINDLSPGELTGTEWVSKDTTITELESIQFQFVGYDPDGESLSYNWRVDNSTVSNDSIYNFITNYNSLRNYEISLDVTDNYDAVKNALHYEWNITVNDVNRAPSIVSFLPEEQDLPVYNVEPEVTFEISATDSDLDNTLNFAWLIDADDQTINDSTFVHTFSENGGYTITAIVSDGVAADSTVWNVTSYVGIEELHLPKQTQLHQNYPNPFNPETTITYDIAEAGQVSINVLNYKGELVSSLVNGNKSAGRYSVRWNCSDSKGKTVTSGMYFIVMHTRNYSKVVKALMVK